VTTFVLIACVVAYVAGYRLYARWLAARVFRLDARAVTPAHAQRDNIDYVPSGKYVLFGHHYASIAGLSPMLGPAIAVIWGWLPAVLWVVLGTLFIGAVHDFGALVLSMRARGQSIGKVAEAVVGPRAKSLFHLIIFFLVALAMGVFVQVVGQLFSPQFYPEAVVPSIALIGLAAATGVLIYRAGADLRILTAAGFVLTLASIGLALALPRPQLPAGAWNGLLLGYAFGASVLPVWLLLQPRDYLNSLLLYLGLGLIFGGVLLLRPGFVAPAIDLSPPGAPPLFPFMFIVIACGAISGFHGLVSSGTTAKQIDREPDARFIGYGRMIGESLLGLAAVLACTAGFASADVWREHYASWNAAQGLGRSMAAFVDGAASFVTAFGVGERVARTFIALVAVSFALTTLDSATRLLRYNIEEVSETIGAAGLANRFASSALAVSAIGFFAFFRIDGQPAGLALWTLFGTTNQILGGLTLLTITLYLLQRGAPYLVTLVPMVFVVAVATIAMAWNLHGHVAASSYLLAVIGAMLLALALWLAAEGAIRFARLRGTAHRGGGAGR
jgi:carbon starvation protein